jgi:hypothetical protein
MGVRTKGAHLTRSGSLHMKQHHTSIVRMSVLGLLASAIFAQSALEADPKDWRKIMPDEILSGWMRIPKLPSDGVKPYVQWTLDEEKQTLACDGRGQHEWLRYEEELGDFIFHAEWMVSREVGYNAGVGVRLSPYGEIWHEAQISEGGGYLFGITFKDGRLQRAGLRKQMTQNRIAPPGEWNIYEIRCQGEEISLWVNGATVNTWSGNAVRRGYVALEAAGHAITFRNLQIKVLRQPDRNSR